jgi:hypothetical protein
MRTLFSRILGAICAASAIAAHAGGPLSVCSAGVQLKYPGAGSVTLSYDLGNLGTQSAANGGGTRTKATADAMVNSAIALWNNVGTATVTLTRGADLPVDVTSANYAPYWNQLSDGINPVIYDNDGSVVDSIYGVGASANVLGVAGSGYQTFPVCQYVEGRAVINGKITSVSNAQLTNVFAHELGHFIGLDHTQLDGVQGLATSNYPMMYPIAYRSAASLHEDDAAAVSQLYPDTTVNATYGTLTGTFVTGAGVPILGTNIWARNTTTNQVFSVASDYLQQGTGFFKLLLTPGTYTLYAEAISTDFTGGSGIGPYSDDLTGLSFQPPNYTGANGTGTPLNVTMTPTFSITAGCAATVTFRSTGSGTVGGNCGAATVPAAMTSPANGTTLTASSQLFQWNSAAGATLYQVWVGNSVGTYDIGYFPAAGTTTTSSTVTGLPTDGRTLYVRLNSLIGGTWYSRDYTYTAATIAAATPASISNPANGTTLSGASQTFQWNSAAGATLYQLWIGNSPGAYDIGYYPAAGTTATSLPVAGIPTNGRTLYVRLNTLIGGTWYSRDYTYAASAAPDAASMLSPTNASTLGGASQTFQWNSAPGATLYQVWVGNSPGSYDFGYFPAAGTTATSLTVNGLPTDGRTLYVRLYSAIGGNWYFHDYTYVAAASAGASMISPASGSSLAGPAQVFKWTSAPGATLYQLWVGNSPGAYDVGYFPAAGTTATSLAVAGLPTDGRTLYVRLYSAIAGVWQYRDYTYVAAAGAPASMISPANGGLLSGATQTFQWNSAPGATLYQLWVGNSPGAYDVGYFPASGTTATSLVVGGLPTDGRTLYVRLYSLIGGIYYSRDYTYTAGP